VSSRELVDRGHGVVGVDLSLPMLTRAHARLGSCIAVGDGEGVWSVSPGEQADQIAARSWSMLWDLSDDVWDEVVVPTIAALRALPEPDRRRDRTGRFDVVVFEPR
jgi:hypothetical protein